MFSGLFKCKSCEAKDKNIQLLESHNAYLKRLVDKLLIKQGVMFKKEKEEPEVLSEVEKILANGGSVFGEEI